MVRELRLRRHSWDSGLDKSSHPHRQTSAALKQKNRATKRPECDNTERQPTCSALKEGLEGRIMAPKATPEKTIIKKTPDVCGGEACIGNRRIMVWLVVAYRELGRSDERIMNMFDPPL